MILQKTVTINPLSKRSYWESLGYEINGKELEVSVFHLAKSSNVSVLCQCNTCDRNYYQRISRDTEVCGSCKAKTRMVGNSLSKKSPSIPKNTILSCIDRGLNKKDIMSELNISSYSVLNGILNHYSIEMEPYKGTKSVSESRRKELCDFINKNYPSSTVAEVSRALKVSPSIIRYWIKRGYVSLPSQFQIWQSAYETVLKNINFYVKENETKTLKDIAIENDISVEHLKKAFSVKGIDVKLHSYNKSQGEKEVIAFVQSLGIKCHSVFFDRTFEIDCFAKDYKFGIEYCGEYWHRYDPSKNNRLYHQTKMKACLEHNVTLMTIFESEWKYKRAIIESMIRNRLGFSSKVYARNCEVRKITSSEARIFHEANHINGYVPSSINIGLFAKDELLLCLSLSKTRFDKDIDYEITRLSSKLNHVVVGGLSKAFAHFVKIANPSTCMTFSDLRFGIGQAYVKLGFEHVATTPPNYFYYHKNTETLENRMKYQKGKLESFSNFDPEKTELQIMEEAGYYRIYDCGNNKFVWKRKGLPQEPE